jgi:diguanylate cyclase (GGDEF)-like protein/PAS domain S-box-containing protein
MFNTDGKPVQAITVLLVEDNPRDANLVFRALEDRGNRFSVTTVATLADALVSLSAASFDVILLDIMLPDSSGFATIATIRKAAPAIPLIVLTGFDDNDMAVAAVEAGVQDFLIKGDFEDAMIERAVRHAIARSHLEERLRASEERLKGVLDLAHDAVLSTDGRQRIVLFNPAAERMFGYRTDEIVGRSLSLLIPEPLRVAHAGHFEGFIREGVESRVMVDRPEVSGLRRDGGVFPVEVSLSRSEGPDGPLFTAMIRDITDRKRNEAELRLLATTDPLTGLANRRHLIERAERELLRLHRFDNPFTLMTLDVDHFKRINDTYGHACGDRALCALAASCVGLLREIDMVGRMGGEEFTIILPETIGDEAMLVADRIRRGIAKLRFDTDPPESEFGFTVSIGVAECHREDARIEQPLARADHALYEAKATGRNRVVRAPVPYQVPA